MGWNVRYILKTVLTFGKLIIKFILAVPESTKKYNVPVENPCAPSFSTSCTSSKGAGIDVELTYDLYFRAHLLQMKSTSVFFLPFMNLLKKCSLVMTIGGLKKFHSLAEDSTCSEYMLSTWTHVRVYLPGQDWKGYKRIWASLIFFRLSWGYGLNSE